MTEQWKPDQWTRGQMEERRLYAEPLIQSGKHSSRAIADVTGVSPSTVRGWRRWLRLKGSLTATLATGAPSRLTDAQVAEIVDLIRGGPDSERFPDQCWTTSRVRDLIGTRYGIWYHAEHVRKLLHRWGFSCQKPEKRAIERDEEEIERWLENRVPELEKLMDEGVTLAFGDEMGSSLKPTVTRTWATIGETPILTAKTNWEKLSTIGAITTSGQFLQQTHKGSIKGQQVIDFLKHILRFVAGRIIVLLDNASIHRTKALKAFVEQHDRLTVEYLPKYAPELNPIELVWAFVKQTVLRNFCPTDVSQLKSRLNFAWQRIRYTQLPDRLLNRLEVLAI